MKRIMRRPKLIVLLFTMVILIFIGVSYGSWSNILSISGAFTTGNFHIEFGNKRDVQVALVTADSRDNITIHQRIKDINITKNDDKNMVVDINDSLINKMKDSDYMLQIKYPIKTTDNSKIKAIQPIEADFNKPDSTITLTPDTIRFITNGTDRALPIDINNRDYVIKANVYKQIEEDGIASVFLEITDINNEFARIGSVEYEDLGGVLAAEVSYDNPIIDVEVEAEYSLEISIDTEQFNNVEGVNKYEK